jgi:rubredoxin
MTVVGAILLAAACGGDDGSGVDGGKKMSDLSDSEAQDVCMYAEDAQGGPRTVTCDGEEFEFTPDDLECENATADEIPASCDMTVDEYEDCVDDLADLDPCDANPDLPSSCDKLFSAACQGD